MHTAFTRANVVFFFSLSTLFLLGSGCALSYLTHTRPASTLLETSPGAVEISNVHVGFPKPFRGAIKGLEYALVEFDLKADLRPLWNWNTKQLLVSVVAVYNSPSHPKGNEQLLWGRIINETQGPAASLLDERIYWEMDQDLNEYYRRGKELSLLSATRGDLGRIGLNAGSDTNRSITLRLQYEVFPLIGSTFLGKVESQTAKFQIERDQPVYTRQY